MFRDSSTKEDVLFAFATSTLSTQVSTAFPTKLALSERSPPDIRVQHDDDAGAGSFDPKNHINWKRYHFSKRHCTSLCRWSWPFVSSQKRSDHLATNRVRTIS